MSGLHRAAVHWSFDAGARVRVSWTRVDPLLLAYLSFTFILVVTPGSTTAVVVRNTLTGGRSAGLAAAAGAAVGNTSHATAAGLGLGLLFARWPLALVVLRVAGAAYLAWLGVSSLYRVARHADGGLKMLANGQEGTASTGQRRSSFRQGFTVNILNPAIATFYLIVVPSFLPPAPPRWYFAVLAAIHVLLALVCHGCWVLALDQVRRLFSRPGARRALEAATGIALIALAARVFLRS